MANKKVILDIQKMNKIRGILWNIQELNVVNYDHEQVVELNNAMAEMYQIAFDNGEE